jgi:hypothetical protein
MLDLGGLSVSNSPTPPTQPAAQYGASFNSPPPTTPANNMNDLLGVFGGTNQNGAFEGENVWSDIPQQNGTQTNKSNEDILGLF